MPAGQGRYRATPGSRPPGPSRKSLPVRSCPGAAPTAEPPNHRKTPCARSSAATRSDGHERRARSARIAVAHRLRQAASTSRRLLPNALSRRIRRLPGSPRRGRRLPRSEHRTRSCAVVPALPADPGPVTSAPPHSGRSRSRFAPSRRCGARPARPWDRRSDRAGPRANRAAAPHRNPGMLRSRWCRRPGRCCGPLPGPCCGRGAALRRRSGRRRSLPARSGTRSRRRPR